MTIKVLDLFSGGSSGDDLDTHTPDTDVVGNGWSVEPANGIELNGSGSAVGNSVTDSAIIDAGTTDQRITMNIDENSNNGTFRVHLRRDNSAYASRNGYDVMWRNTGSADTLRLYEITAGSNTELVDTQVAFHDNTVAHVIVCEAKGTSLTVTVDGTQRLSTTDSTHTTGDYAGFSWEAGSTLEFEDFEVDDTLSGHRGANRGIMRGVARGIG